MVRVVEAKLFRSFDKFGRMDPFATAEWLPSSGRKVVIGRTQSAWGAHMTPSWNHSCRELPYQGSGSGCKLHFRVEEENFRGMGTPTFCGEVTADLNEILSSAVFVSQGLLSTKPLPLKLVKRGEETGTITVQITLRTRTAAGSAADGTEFTLADPGAFVTPVKRLGVSGGTAPFFDVRLRSPEAGKSETHWIGKDLSRAMDEIGFYEQRAVLERGGGHGLEPLFAFTFDYAGVLECAEEGAEADAAALQLLVLRNLRDGRSRLRMLDVKMGEQTAAANWKGKSKFAALRQGVVDGLTNSQVEGFRLEGFDGQPQVLQSMDPLLDLGGAEQHGQGFRKKALRVMLQRMPASEMFMHFLDLHHEPCDPEDARWETVLTHTELVELVMDEICKRLIQLAIACRQAPVPQKWIGSSVALGFDDQHLPTREEAEADVRSTTLVNIFDWGRSELNTLEQHAALSAEDQADRATFWRYYVGGVDRLAWEACRAYWHQFCNAGDWQEVHLVVYDFDSMSDNDLIGQALVPLAPCGPTTAQLLSTSNSPVQGSSGPSTISYSISWRPLPQSRRLRGAWRVAVHQACDLPAHDIGLDGSSSDPFVSVTAISSGCHFRQDSTVAEKNLNPVWHETFELPVAAPDGPIIAEAFLGPDFLNGANPARLFLSTSASADAEGSAMTQWKQLLRNASGRRSLRGPACR